MNIENLIHLIFAIIGAILTYAIVPWIKTKLDTEKREQLANNIKIAVQAAEQTITGEKTGFEKKKFVRRWLADRGIDFSESDVWDIVDAMIESAVLELKREES